MASATIIDAMADPQLLGDEFGGPSFEAWRALPGGFCGLRLDEDRSKPSQPSQEAVPARQRLVTNFG